MRFLLLAFLNLAFFTGCSKTPAPGLKHSVFNETMGVFESTASTRVKDYNNIEAVAIDYAIKDASKAMFINLQKYMEKLIDTAAENVDQKKTAYYIDNKKFSILMTLGSFRDTKLIKKKVNDGIATATIGVKKEKMIRLLTMNMKKVFGEGSPVYQEFLKEND